MEVLSVWPSTLIIQFKFFGSSFTIWFKITATFWISSRPGIDKSAFPTSNRTSDEKTNLSPTIFIPSFPSTNSLILPKKSDLYRSNWVAWDWRRSRSACNLLNSATSSFIRLSSSTWAFISARSKSVLEAINCELRIVISFNFASISSLKVCSSCLFFLSSDATRASAALSLLPKFWSWISSSLSFSSDRVKIDCSELSWRRSSNTCWFKSAVSRWLFKRLSELSDNCSDRSCSCCWAFCNKISFCFKFEVFSAFNFSETSLAARTFLRFSSASFWDWTAAHRAASASANFERRSVMSCTLSSSKVWRLSFSCSNAINALAKSLSAIVNFSL